MKPDIPVLYEDNHLLVVVKPPNMPTQADESGDPDVLTALKEDLKVRHRKPSNVFLGLVHRLDRPVGGAMVFAKTSKAASRLSDQVRTRALEKTYLAVVRGEPHPAEATLVHHLAKNARTNTVSVVPAGHPDGKEAMLDYVRLQTVRTVGTNGFTGHRERADLTGHAGRPERADRAGLAGSAGRGGRADIASDAAAGRDALTLVRVRLHTGRPHQIRVQMAANGCPLFGDQKYGAQANRPGQQIALWSHRLGLIHPTTKEPLSFVSLPPAVEPWTRFDLSGLV